MTERYVWKEIPARRTTCCGGGSARCRGPAPARPRRGGRPPGARGARPLRVPRRRRARSGASARGARGLRRLADVADALAAGPVGGALRRRRVRATCSSISPARRICSRGSAAGSRPAGASSSRCRTSPTSRSARRSCLGRFPYAERGILDRTHLRFFTRATGARPARGTPASGSAAWRPTAMPLRARRPGARARAPGAGRCAPSRPAAARVWPTLFGYQFVFEADRVEPVEASRLKALARPVSPPTTSDSRIEACLRGGRRVGRAARPGGLGLGGPPRRRRLDRRDARAARANRGARAGICR